MNKKEKPELILILGMTLLIISIALLTFGIEKKVNEEKIIGNENLLEQVKLDIQDQEQSSRAITDFEAKMKLNTGGSQALE